MNGVLGNVLEGRCRGHHMEMQSPLRTVTQLRSLLRDEPEVWAQRDNRNRWFCPHCGRVTTEIIVPPEGGLLLLQDVPYQIQDHLRNCGSVKAGLPPTKHFEEPDERTDSGIRKALHDTMIMQRHTLRSAPEVEGYELDCLYRPMEAVGGDFYEFVHRPDGRLGIAIGDTSGHGVESCMLMAVTKKLFSIFGRDGASPQSCLTAVNNEVHADAVSGMFVSALYAILDPYEDTLTYARAGHPPLLVFNPAKETQYEVLDGNGLALGLVGGNQFGRLIEARTIELQPGDLAVFYTDGLTELENGKGEELGIEGLAELLEKYYDRDIKELTRQIWFQAEKRFKGRGAPDDITLVTVRKQ